MDRVFFIATAKHPVVLAIMLAAVVAGVLGLVTGHSSPSIEELLPQWETPWNAILALGGGICLSCLAFKHPTSLMIERAGMTLLGAELLVYATAICLVDDAFVSTAATTITALGIGCLWRVWQITRDLKALARMNKEG